LSQLSMLLIEATSVADTQVFSVFMHRKYPHTVMEEK